MADRSFPEPTHSKHKPDGGKPSYVKGSHGMPAGHTGHDGRMPHPQGQPIPSDESGEGLNR